MSVDRYRRQGANSTSFVAALAVNAALIAVIATSAPAIFAPPETVLDGYNVPIAPPPPPPPVPEKREVATQPAATTIPIPDRKVDVDVPSVNDIATIDVLPPIADPTPPGSGTGVTVDAPRSAPVMVDAAPDPRARFQPDYPASERRSGLEGVVVVRVLIGADGRVKSVERVRAASAAFFEATRKHALARWRFSPATEDGIPVESWRTMTVRFLLQG